MRIIHAEFTQPTAEPDEFEYDSEPGWEQWTHCLSLHSYKLLHDNKWDRKMYLYSYRSLDPLPVKNDMSDDEFDRHSYTDALFNREEYRSRDPIHWDVSAASNHDHLLVAFFRRDKYAENEYDSKFEHGDGPFINVKIIFNLPNYTKKCVEGPRFDCDFDDCKITKPFIFIHNDNVFVKVWTKSEDKNLQKASLKSLLSDNCTEWQ